MNSSPTPKVPVEPSPSIVIIRLLIFAAALGLAPVAAYFVSLKHLWPDNTTYAALFAVLIANLVLGAFIISAIREETGAPVATTPSTLKDKKQL